MKKQINELIILQELKSLEIAVKFYLRHKDEASLSNCQDRVKNLSKMLLSLKFDDYKSLKPVIITPNYEDVYDVN